VDKVSARQYSALRWLAGINAGPPGNLPGQTSRAKGCMPLSAPSLSMM